MEMTNNSVYNVHKLVFKKDGKWFTGEMKFAFMVWVRNYLTLENSTEPDRVMAPPSILNIKEIEKKSDIQDVENFITLKRSLLLDKVKVESITELSDKILKTLNIESIHLYQTHSKDVPKNGSKEFERRWWKEKHPTCMQCAKTCKQSKFVVLACNKFITNKQPARLDGQAPFSISS